MVEHGVLMKCRRCKQVIAPDDPMVVVATGKPRSWYRRVGERLFTSPGKWHYRCAPNPVRQYASPIDDDEPLRDRAVMEVHHL
jgi:hypothetical protein